MSLRPLLFVGCGGSGGVTLQYVMDNLRTTLLRAAEAKSAADGHTYELPRRVLPMSWQFVHVDVPSSPDGETPERPPSVPNQGGRYVPLAPSGLTWGQVADRVWKTAGKTQPQQIAGWLRRPGPNDPPLENGAGQERAVGRGVTLSSLAVLNDQLSNARGRLQASEGIAELQYVASLLDAGSITQTPAVFIVSSMAGGSGASMVLDVAQVLARIDPTLAMQTSMFLYTSQAFSELPKALRRGVEPNGLAAMGELIGLSLGASLSEGALLQQLGINGADVDQPYKRVFPIGNRVGANQALFGDGSQESIYRAMGNGLASLVSSPTAVGEFLHYDMANQLPQNTDLSWLGEGSPTPDPVQWGSFGYARLSLGRDRYGEYVSQRLARAAVDRLVEGHLQAEQTGEEALEAASQDYLRRFNMRLGVSEGAMKAVALLGRGDRALAMKQTIQQSGRDTIKRVIFDDPQLATPMDGKKFNRLVNMLVGGQTPALQRAAHDRAYALVYEWQAALVRDVLIALDEVIAQKGLPTARQVLLRFTNQVSEWQQSLQAEAHHLQSRGGAMAPPPDLAAALETQPQVGPSHPLRARLQDGFANNVARSTAAEAAKLMAEVLKDFKPSFADPIAKALANELAKLTGERSRPPRGVALSDLRTQVYAEWPVPSNPVPDRFQGAQNEVVLMETAAFAPQFDAHLRDVARSRGSADMTGDTMASVLAEIITDRWPGQNDEEPESRIAVVRSAWVPQGLTTDPADPTRVRAKSGAIIEYRLSVSDLLERSRAWVWRPDGEFGPFLQEGLRSYLDPSKPTFSNRLNQLTTQFGATLQQALPLIGVDTGAFGQVHPGEQLTEDFKFSQLPFQGLAGVDDQLRDVVRDRPSVSSKVVGIFDNALGQGEAVAHIDVFGSYAPMSPLAIPSLLQPLANSWRQAVAQGDGARAFFWRNRRARPLGSSVAMSVAERRASVAGYIIGKITGRLRGSYETKPNQQPKPIQVYSHDGVWLDFPSPLLTPYQSSPKGGRAYVADEFPALLESQLLAIADCGFRTDFSPLLPYVELRHLFGRVEQAQTSDAAVDQQNRGYDNSTGMAYLTAWIAEGTRPPGAPAFPAPGRDADPVDLTASDGRKAAAIAYCESRRGKFAKSFHTDDPASNPYLHPYDRRPMIAVLAEDFVWAYGEVIELIEAAELDDGELEDLEQLEDLV